MASRLVLIVAAAGLALCPAVQARKAAPVQVMDWPATNPVLRFTISKIREIGSYGGQNTYVLDTEVENLSPKRISHAGFNFYLFDKKHIRIGDGFITISNVAPGEAVKIRVSANTIGVPASMSISPADLPPELQALAPPKMIPVTVFSVPAGARLKVDGKDAGMTPIAVRLSVGSHKLEFGKEGFTTGTFPLTVAPDQLPGGSVTFELGGASFDTVDLRDGTVINGDVESVDATSVVMRVGGNLQRLDRNLVKRILFVQRELPSVAPQAQTPAQRQ